MILSRSHTERSNKITHREKQSKFTDLVHCMDHQMQLTEAVHGSNLRRCSQIRLINRIGAIEATNADRERPRVDRGSPDKGTDLGTGQMAV